MVNQIEDADESRLIYAQLKDTSGGKTGPMIQIPANINTDQLNILINTLLDQSDHCPYSFYIDDVQIVDTLDVAMPNRNSEQILEITYLPQALFKVKAVSRCSSSLEGHSEAVLGVQFSPDGKQLASGSGDTSVRFWDLNTETPKMCAKGHTDWVLCIAWSPNAKVLASGSKDKTVRLWDPITGKSIGNPLTGHSNYITCLAWEPFHINPQSNHLASSSKDCTIKLWDTVRRQCYMTLSQHTDIVTCIRWSGEGWIYSASRDRNIKVWDGTKGTLIKNLPGHAHWVNSLALSTDFVLRTGPFDYTDKKYSSLEEAQKAALARYEAVRDPEHKERLISGSDDFTMFLWTPHSSNKPICRITGHQGLVNHVVFSPDGRTIASASFDKSVKLWNGVNGKFIAAFRGHVGPVYQVCWSADSRMLISSSKDSTIKIWDMKTKKMKLDLPGHLDEVYSVDWNPNGETVASGGKDRVLKIWKQ